MAAPDAIFGIFLIGLMYLRPTAAVASKAMLQVLKQCEGSFTRENIMKQAANLHDLELPTLLRASE